MISSHLNRPKLSQDLKIALCLALACAFATALLFPYLMAMFPQMLKPALDKVPLVLLIGAQSAQAAVIFGLLAFAGLRVGFRFGLDAPHLRALISRSVRPLLSWQIALCLGLLAGAAILGIDRLFVPFMPPSIQSQPLVTDSASALTGFFASFYGAICEEVQLRLFVMTIAVWLLSSFLKPAASIYWIAISSAALLFAAGHLPAAAQIWPLDAVVIGRTVILNSVAGVAFGWLFWRRGLEAAMIAHFVTDLVLHVAAPLLLS